MVNRLIQSLNNAGLKTEMLNSGRRQSNQSNQTVTGHRSRFKIFKYRLS